MLDRKNNSIVKNPETAVIVGLITNNQQKEKANDYLNELAFLIETAGGKPVKRFTQALDYPNVKTYVGSGKLDEIKQYVKAAEIDMVVFDDELGGSQIRNLEKVLECKIIDRTNLILDCILKSWSMRLIGYFINRQFNL